MRIRIFAIVFPLCARRPIDWWGRVVAVSTAIVSCMHHSCLRSRPAGQVRGRGPIKAAGSAPLVHSAADG